MKTILINKALITIALLSTIQCGYGTVTLSTLEDITNPDNSTESNGVYTLKTGNDYNIQSTSIINLTTNLVIPANVKVTSSYSFAVGGRAGSGILGSLTNYGIFENNRNMFIEVGSSLNLSRNGMFTNDSSTNMQVRGTLNISGSGTFTNNKNKTLYVNQDGFLNIFGGTFTNSGRLDMYGLLTLSGGEFTITNDSLLYASKNSSLNIFDGTFTNSGKTSLNQNSSLTISGNGAFIMGSGSRLDFHDSGTFSVSDNNTHEVTLNGSIYIYLENASLDVSKMNLLGSGTIDMSSLRPYSSDATEVYTFNNNNLFKCGVSQSLPNIKLPFNCKFGYTDSQNVKHDIDLRSANKVYYTTFTKTSWIGDDDNVIRKIVNTYGDYDNNSELGVTLLRNTDGTLNMGKINITKKDNGIIMSLSAVTNDTTYNQFPYKLDTTELDIATQGISKDTHYNFGFTGITPVKITGSGTAIFMGDNSGYTPGSDITLPSNVVFGAKDSLFQFTQTYTKGIFSAGSGLENTIPAGKTVMFIGGFSLGAGHTLIVKGTLIG